MSIRHPNSLAQDRRFRLRCSNINSYPRHNSPPNELYSTLFATCAHSKEATFKHALQMPTYRILRQSNAALMQGSVTVAVVQPAGRCAAHCSWDSVGQEPATDSVGLRNATVAATALTHLPGLRRHQDKCRLRGGKRGHRVRRHQRGGQVFHRVSALVPYKPRFLLF